MVELVALGAIGIEKILGNEIKHLGYRLVSNAPGRVIYESDEAGMFRSNLRLRTADRIFLKVAEFPCADFDALFDGTAAVPWQDYVKKNSRIVVDKVRCFRSKLDSVRSVQSVAHKAIYKKLGDVWRMQSLPETGETVMIRIYIEDDKALILLDLSGDPLNKRGYRTAGGPAPIRETLAAALLLSMNWRRKVPLHDPFCGSGTIVTEAALYGYNVAPGLGRAFGMEHLAFYNQQQASDERNAAAAEIRPDCLLRVTGSDISEEAVVRAGLNAEHAMVTAGRALQRIGNDARLPRPEFTCADFKSLSAPYETGLMVTNPPYGERLGELSEAESLYRDMHCFVDTFSGWTLGVITSVEEFAHLFGVKESKKRAIREGNLQTWFYSYDTI